MQAKSETFVYPSAFNILGQRWKIVTVKRLTVGGAACMGATLYDSRTIKIKAGQTERQLRDTLFHELLHVALFVTGQSQLLHEDLEEAIIRALEHALAGLVTLSLAEVPSEIQAGPQGP